MMIVLDSDSVAEYVSPHFHAIMFVEQPNLFQILGYDLVLKAFL